MPVTKVCQQCSKEFSIPMRRSELVKFCSRECRTEAGYVTCDCPACGKQFKRKNSDNARSKVKYCSAECDRASRKGRKHAEDPNAVKHFVECLQCKSSFQVTLTRKDTAKFCSSSCKMSNPEYLEQMSEVQRGEKSWRWAGGVYKNRWGYIKVRSNGPSQTEHRRVMLDAILKADPNHPFIVEINGERFLDSKIEVHHIDKNRSNNDIKNLLAVTKYAHSQIHHRNKRPNPWECWPSNPERW